MINVGVISLMYLFALLIKILKFWEKGQKQICNTQFKQHQFEHADTHTHIHTCTHTCTLCPSSRKKRARVSIHRPDRVPNRCGMDCVCVCVRVCMCVCPQFRQLETEKKKVHTHTHKYINIKHPRKSLTLLGTHQSRVNECMCVCVCMCVCIYMCVCLESWYFALSLKTKQSLSFKVTLDSSNVHIYTHTIQIFKVSRF